MLVSRGFADNAKSELNPELELSQINDLKPAALRLIEATKAKKRILIHGDYDADGITASAVLCLGLRALGANVEVYIPNRLSDGYGIHPDRVSEHIKNADLFITVDCGVSNLEEIKALQAAGVEVIISDHHQPGQTLPDCLVVHPKMAADHQQGQPELTGSGVAYHLLWAIHQELGIEEPVVYSDIATIGIIADVAPLMGENRALIVEGLEHMQNSKWPGLSAAIKQSKISGKVTATDVAFRIAPRLNAAGRLGEADLGLELLMTASERRARELAVYLDARNAERRNIQDAMFIEALEKVDKNAPAIVIDDDNWHPGVMGIVASKLLEEYYKPVFIIAQGKGSVRSTPGISAVNGLTFAKESLKRFGGHSQAAGFAIEDNKIEDFRKLIYEYVEQFETPLRKIEIDALIDADKINVDLYDALARLEPYGQGHPSPVFALSGRLDMAKAVGKNGNTLQLRIAGIKGVAWQKGDLANSLQLGQDYEAIISLQENNWQNKRNIEFIAEDIRKKQSLSFMDTSQTQKIFRGQPIDRQPNTTVAKHIKTIEDLDKLSKLIEEDIPIYIDFSTSELKRLEEKIAQYPTVMNLRQGFVALKRGQKLPYNLEKKQLIFKILTEIGLLDEHKRLVNKKTDPYQSETLVDGLCKQYELESFLNAYRFLDDASFAKAVETLWKIT